MCGGARNSYAACLTCKRQKERERSGVVNPTGETGVGKHCAICGVELTAGGPTQYSLDHDHGTGAVRDWLCVRCNAGLGNFQEQPETLRAAADYIERHLSDRSGQRLVS